MNAQITYTFQSKIIFAAIINTTNGQTDDENTQVWSSDLIPWRNSFHKKPFR